MVRNLRTALLAASAITVLGGASGCANSRDAHFYVLTPLPATEGPKEPPGHPGPAVGLRPVELPAELDRPQIVTRTGQNELALAEFDRWAAPLGDQFTRVLAEDLATLIPTDRLEVFPWGGDTLIDYEVVVEVMRSEGTLGGNCWLTAGWTVFKKGERATAVRGKGTYSEPAGASYADMVAAQSRLVAALGRDIAKAVRGLAR